MSHIEDEHDTRRALRLPGTPTPAGVLAFIALSIAIGGTALAATGQLVNIADPSNEAHVAKVDASGRLTVGDGAGAMTVDGTVTARETALSSLVHIVGNGGGVSEQCKIVATPPAGKAWVLKSLSVNVYDEGSTPFGSYQFIAVFPNKTCDLPYATIFTPTALGLEQWSFEPGLVVPAGGAVAVYELYTQALWDVTAEGYAVPAASVPQTAAVPGKASSGPRFPAPVR